MESLLECVSQYERIANECHRIEAKQFQRIEENELMYQTLVADLRNLEEHYQKKFKLLDKYEDLYSGNKKIYYKLKLMTAKQFRNEMNSLSQNLDQLSIDLKMTEESIERQKELLNDFPGTTQRSKELHRRYVEIYDICRLVRHLIHSGRVSYQEVETIQVLNFKPYSERERFVKVPFSEILEWSYQNNRFYAKYYGSHRNV